MDRGAWRATVYGFTKSRTRLKWLSMHVLLTLISSASFDFLNTAFAIIGMAHIFLVFNMLFLKKKIIYFNWRIINLQYYDGFCHVSVWIGHRRTYPLPPEWPPSLLPSLCRTTWGNSIETYVVLVAHLFLTLWDAMGCSPPGSSVHGKNTGAGGHFLLHGIFPTQGLNPGLPHCGQTLYHLSHQGSPEVYNLLLSLVWILLPHF